jgi:hypothetical protein
MYKQKPPPWEEYHAEDEGRLGMTRIDDAAFERNVENLLQSQGDVSCGRSSG